MTHAASADSIPNIVVLRSAMDPSLVMSVNPKNNAVYTGRLNLDDRFQQWYRLDGEQNFRLINVGTGGGLTLPTAAPGTTLATSGNGDLWNVLENRAFQAVRFGSDYNLNVTIHAASRDCGAPVIVWGWEGGNHQRWALTNLRDIAAIPSTPAPDSGEAEVAGEAGPSAGSAPEEPGGAFPYGTPNIVFVRSAMNPNLVLSASPQRSQAVMAWYDPEDARQQWYRQDHDQHFKLINVETGGGLTTTNAIVRGAELYAYNAGELWNTLDIVAWQALRAAANIDLNVTINAASHDLGTPTILWDWESGNHQRWALTNRLDMQPLPVHTQLLDIAGHDDRRAVDDGQRIIVKAYDWRIREQFIFQVTMYGEAFSIKNVATGKYIGFQGNGKPVGRFDAMCAQTLWTWKKWGDPGPFETTWYLVRPYLDELLVLSGGSDGVWVRNWPIERDPDVWTLPFGSE